MEKEGNILRKKYEVGKLLGQGTFAKVYHARDLKTGQSVAIKVIDKEKVLKVGLVNQTKREISAMGLVKHQNVVELYEVMATKTKIYFVMEYAKGGELFQKIAKGRLKEDAARKYFQQLICAVSFCHSRGVYHRDLKPENLLLDEEGNLKVSDFGLSALSESRLSDGLLHTTCGTPAYVAPEVINRKGYDGAKTDIWSCGVILYVLLAGYIPFHESNIMQMYDKIVKADYICPDWFPPEPRRLISKILDPNTDTRITMAKIMENSWFRKGLGHEHSKKTRNTIQHLEKPLIDIDSVLQATTCDDTADTKPESPKVNNLNAFDIISLSTGFDLSGLFVRQDQKDEVQFTSLKPAFTIMSKLEQIAGNLKLEVVKKDQASLKLNGSKERRNVNLSFDIQIFEITTSFHLVEVKKSGGDSLEYQNMMKEEIRPALRDIVWAWQGEQMQD